eukprot:1154189-Pelagomonas_calceolata.AAC.1
MPVHQKNLAPGLNPPLQQSAAKKKGLEGTALDKPTSSGLAPDTSPFRTSRVDRVQLYHDIETSGKLIRATEAKISSVVLVAARFLTCAIREEKERKTSFAVRTFSIIHEKETYWLESR